MIKGKVLLIATLLLTLLYLGSCEKGDDADKKAPVDRNPVSCCSNSYVFKSIGNDSVYIPNAFTPNGDGINDYFTIYTTDSFSFKQITITNDTGVVLFVTDTTTGLFYYSLWDGTINDADIAALANVITETEQEKPSLVLELVPTGSSRINMGYSDKNPIHTDESGRSYTLVGGQNKPIVHWQVTWEMQLKIHNQSSYPAFNIKIEKANEKWFTKLDSLPPINNVVPLSILPLDAEYQSYIESVFTDADELLKSRIPDALTGLIIKVTYQNEQKKSFSKKFKLENGSLNEV